jgi:predicted Zn-dependent peptidase
LSKAKQYIKGKVALAMEDPHDKMEWYLGQEAFLGRIKTIKQMFEKIDEVTQEDVLAVAQEVLVDKNLNLAVIGPYADSSIFENRLTI